MHILSKTAAAIAFATALAVTPASAQVSQWNGRYVWEESLGRIGGASPSEGPAAFVTYTLSIGAGNGPTRCMITAQGFQTNRRMQCTVTPQRNSAIVKFYRFATPAAASRYRIGAALFTMTQTRRGIVTRLQALSPASDTSPRSGRLFRRIG